MENTKMKLTGKPSIDKPWLQFYPEQLRNVEVPKMTIEEFLKYKNQDENRTAFEYYGNKITWKTLWEEVDKAARSLKVLGYGDGRRIPLFLQSVPAHYILLMAAERIGATIICRDDIPEELCFAIRKSKADTAFVMDYTSKEDEELFRATTPMTRMIKISPYDYADKDAMPEYTEKEIASRYSKNTETTEGNNSKGDRPEGGDGATTIITKSKETFQNARNLTGDFELDGYSSYDAMTDFVDGTLKITSGEMISNFDEFECAINEELASLNSISVGDTITLKNPTTNITYDFKVVGIYEDNSGMDDSVNMYSKSANKIITGSKVVEKLVADDSTLGTNVTPTFVLNSEDVIEEFTNEVKEKGLNDNYTINTNLNEIQNATESIDIVKTFATTFLLIMLAISAVVLFVINMINIRERKYEIGVFRTIGVSKFKLTLQFALEILIVSVVMLGIGAVCGSFFAKPVGNMLLENEIQSVQEETEQISNNFGKGGPMDMNFGGTVNVQTIDTINAVVDITVVAQLLGIGLALMLVSSLASMISIQRFSPLTILKERS